MGVMTPFPPERVVSGATNTPNPTPGTPETVQAVRDGMVASLARVLDPVAYDPRAVAKNVGQQWDRLERRMVAEAHAELAVEAGWRLVVEDDDTIERVAAALAESDGQSWAEIKHHVEHASRWAPKALEHYRSWARVVVRALREDT